MTPGSDLDDALDGHQIRSFVERLWFHLDPGWVDLGANTLLEGDQRRARRKAENEVTQLVTEMASQYNTAVVCVAHYQELWGKLVPGLQAESELHRESPIDGELRGIFARSYILALDAIEGCAVQIAKHVDTPDACREVAGRVAADLNRVKAVRDSLQHIEERVQGLARGIPVPTPILHLGNYSERGFTFTTATGGAATIEVSETALASVRSQMKALDFSLTWRRAGPVCPVCGGSFRPEVLGPEGGDEPSTLGLSWQCRRCGFRITNPNND